MTKIPFKAVVVDMDGTFVDKDNQFNRTEFKEILAQLQANGIHFIAASGRPAARLADDFKGFNDHVDFVADNGAVLVRDQKVIQATAYSKEAVLKMTKIIQEDFPKALPVTLISGVKHTYCLKSIPEDKKKMMFFFYPNTVEIDDFVNLPDDTYTKVTISYPYYIGKDIAREYNQICDEKTEFKTSGFENIDLVPAGVNKGIGLKEMLKYLQVKPNEIIAFGDSGNDIEMLEMTDMSYCMANGTDEAKKAAKFEAPSNTDDGVFKVLKKYLQE